MTRMSRSAVMAAVVVASAVSLLAVPAARATGPVAAGGPAEASHRPHVRHSDKHARPAVNPHNFGPSYPFGYGYRGPSYPFGNSYYRAPSHPATMYVAPGRRASRWVPGYWGQQWMPQYYTYDVWVPGYFTGAGAWVQGYYETQAAESGGYYQQIWVDGYWTE